MSLKQLVDSTFQLNKQISELEKELSQVRSQLSQLLEQMDDSVEITVGEYIVYKQPCVRVSIDCKLLKEFYPDIYDSFKKETYYVKLIVRKRGENDTNDKDNNE